MSKNDRTVAILNPAANAAEALAEVQRQEFLLKTGALQDAIFNSANFSSIAANALVRAIRIVFANRTYLSPRIAGTVTDALLHYGHRNAWAPHLGARERLVLQLIAEGYTSPNIATRLHLAASTIEVHRRNIMGKFKVHNTAELTKYAVRHGNTPYQ
jgi:DNA-binding NarL/FixJ family response regulator